MHLKKTFLFLAALALPLVSVSRSAAAVNPAIVSADAKWLVYADLNALRASAMGKQLLELAGKAQMDTPGGKVGIDWQKLLATVGSATAYGANISADPKQLDGALVIQGTADFRKIAESVLIQINLTSPQMVVELTDLPYAAYAVRGAPAKDAKAAKEAPEAKAADATEVIIAFPPEPIVLISKSRPQILKSREIFRGTAPSLAKGPASPLSKFIYASEGAYLFAASIVPTEKFFTDDGPQARIVRMASAGSIAIGERGNDTFAHSELIAASDQAAEKLMKILQGMTAMLSLAETTDKQLAEFLNSTTVERKGDIVTLDLAYSSARLGEMIKGLQQRDSARPQDPAVTRAAQMLNGRSLAEWTAEAGPAPAAGAAPLTLRTIENVALKNGTLLTLSRLNNGGQSVRFDRIEIVPAEGGAPLVFRAGYMRQAGPRGNWQQIEFPGADGNYTLKVAYVNDPQGKAAFAVSARDPGAPPPAAGPASSPLIPQPKIK